MILPSSVVKAVVFDCDGLLIDSGECWEESYRQALGGHERTLTDQQASDLNGASVRIAAAALHVDPAELEQLLVANFATMPIALRPGVVELLEHLGGSRPLAVATNAPRTVAVAALDRLGIVDRFDHVISAEHSRDKPAPDVYLAACAALGVDVASAIAFEDSPLGAAAATAAGMPSVFVPSRDQVNDESFLTVPRIDHPRVLELLR